MAYAESLIHVCRLWGTFGFVSPRRRLPVNLRIACKGNSRNTPIRDNLDVWPALVRTVISPSLSTSLSIIKATLEHHDRVHQINLGVSELAEVFAALEAPFPVLTDLCLKSSGNSKPIRPNPVVKFLGGFTHLLSLSFHGIPIPTLPYTKTKQNTFDSASALLRTGCTALLSISYLAWSRVEGGLLRYVFLCARSPGQEGQ